jgi:hypothetical protein
LLENVGNSYKIMNSCIVVCLEEYRISIIDPNNFYLKIGPLYD